jgi:hypothetical protein
MSWRPAGLLSALSALAFALALTSSPDAPRAQGAPAPPAAAWITDREGRPFRVRFDPGHRLYAGLAAAASPARSARPDVTLELGLSLRAAPPPAAAEVFWKRDHHIGHVRLHGQPGGLAVAGQLYRGVFLRHSREGSLTIPTTPPLRLALPFDVGVRVELARFAWQAAGADAPGGLAAELVRGEALIDFLRSERAGRWLGVGWLGAYDVRLGRLPDGRGERDHRVTPMTALGVSGRAESDGGLCAAGFRGQWGRAWSTGAGWHPVLRAEAELEVTPLAINDLPVSLAIAAAYETGRRQQAREQAIDRPLRVLASVRLGVPLRD